MRPSHPRSSGRRRIGALLLLAALAASSAGPLDAQRPAARPSRAVDAGALRMQVRRWRAAHDLDIVRELVALLALPNLASDSAAIRANARHLAAMLERRGVRATLLESPGSPPAVLGELAVPGATRTVVLYAHYDGQPVSPERWTSPPWTPVLRAGPLPAAEVALPPTPGRVSGEWRLYARSASDDKSPIVAMLAALDALREAGVAPSVNVKFFLEGEEEAGSPHLREMLERHASRLAADLWLFGDGPVHQSRRQQVVFGVRGVMGLEMTVYGPRRPLHSGHYGNWAPNPASLLAGLLSGMRDADGRITIAGFADDVLPPSDAERRALAALPSADEALRRELLLGATEAGNAPAAERIMLPALNIRGIESGAVGERAANAVPTEAHASIDFRLVPRQTPARIRELVERHVRERGFHVVHGEPTDEERLTHPRIARLAWEDGYPATRTGMDSPVSRALLRVVEESTGAPVLAVPTLGGSLPLDAFADVLRAPLIVLPIVNHDNNQHGADENLRLQNLFDGIELYAGVLAGLGPAWDAAQSR
jgi:acetylornithine deacetylase/succinyl-diaminopimelate desuccinylase-like protein